MAVECDWLAHNCDFGGWDERWLRAEDILNEEFTEEEIVHIYINIPCDFQVHSMTSWGKHHYIGQMVPEKDPPMTTNHI